MKTQIEKTSYSYQKKETSIVATFNTKAEAKAWLAELRSSSNKNGLHARYNTTDETVLTVQDPRATNWHIDYYQIFKQAK